MHRPTLACILFGLPTLAMASAPTPDQALSPQNEAVSLQSAPKLPDSIESEAPLARLTFVHEAQQVTACKAEAKKKETKLTCSAKLGPGNTAAQLTLKPIVPANLLHEDKRQPIQVALPSQSKRSETSVKLQAGEWELSWAGYSQIKRFRVAGNENLSVSLSSTTGSCIATSQECVLNKTAKTYSISLPKR